MEPQLVLDVRFFSTAAGTEPVRVWLKDLSASDRKIIGEDIKTVQYGWPLGMPLVDHLGGDIWEVRSKLDNLIARTLFAIEAGVMILLHAFVKKQQKTPKPDLDLAKDRLKQMRGQQAVLQAAEKKARRPVRK
jgi:phage-related protein